MSEKKIREQYSQDKPFLEAFGKLVETTILEALKHKLGTARKTEEIIKIPVQTRVKDIDSLISKALYRGKEYANPYDEITDKVGVRFVVLLTSHIKIIENLIKESSLWNSSLERNYEEERLANPKIFDYQSIHYVVTLKEETIYNSIDIPVGTTCEIQVKTLLQHAYSELTHDTVYKPKFGAEPSIVRHVSRSMALIETTDEIFEKVYNELTKTYKEMAEFFDFLTSVYCNVQECNIEEKMNFFLIDSFYPVIKSIETDVIKEFFNNKNYLYECIRQNINKSLLFQQPIIILIYYLASTQKYKLIKIWPLTVYELDPIFADLGISNSID